MGDWPKAKIGELGEVFDGPHATPKTVSEGPIFLGIGALQDGRINLGETRHVTREDFKKWTRRVLPQAGDIVFSYETRLGQAAIIPEGMECCLGRRMGLVRVDQHKILPRYFLYNYISPEFQEFLRSRTVHGATVDRILLTEFPDFPFPCPPLAEQRAIVMLLGALDDKIELNRRMNETLEAMARAIFKDWFVDFGPTRAKAKGRAPYLAPDLWELFPDALDDEGKPVGWEQVKIEDVAEKIAMGPFGSNIKISTFVGEGIPIISGQHLNKTMIEENSFNFISYEHAEKLKSSNVYKDDIIFTHAGNIGQVSYIPEYSFYERYVLSQRQFYLRCNAEIVSPIFMVYFFKSRDGQHKLLANASSSGVPSISRPVTNLKSIDFLLPSKQNTNAFSVLVRNIHKKINANKNETNTLAQIRDLLLPKLMSGEIRLAEAKKMVEDAA